MGNSVGPDQMLHNAASDLGLHYLQRPFCPNAEDYYSNVNKSFTWIRKLKKV